MWQPLSAVMLPGSSGFLSSSALSHVISSSRKIALRYAGDRMWPSIRHGQVVSCHGLEPDDLAPGRVILAAPDGLPDIVRVVATDASALHVIGDAETGPPFTISREVVLAGTDLPARRVGATRRRARRLWLDVLEAVRGARALAKDRDKTVLDKYETQAVFYDRDEATSLPGEVIGVLRSAARPDHAVLVAGCGTGRECRALAAAGLSVIGVDYSPQMIEHATEACREYASRIELLLEDLCAMERPAGQIQAVFFTPDVYSLIPGRSERVALLAKLADWMADNAVILLSARVTQRARTRLLMMLEWAADGATRASGWGSSHTRWIGLAGDIERAFIWRFTPGQLRREIRHSGLVAEGRAAGWYVLKRSD